MSDKKKHFYKTLNNIVATNRIDNEEAYIINDYVSGLENQLQQKDKELEEENIVLKHRLNDMVFGDDYELGARYLRKIGYIGFDEERKVYINKHNNEPFLHKDEKEKDYYIPDEELNEYTKQLEFKLQQKENIIKEVKEKINYYETTEWGLRGYRILEMFKEILDKEVN